MKLYCFDQPTDPVQRLAIRAIGSMENEVQQNFMKMSDADKILTTRLNKKDCERRGIPSLFVCFFMSFRWRNIEGDWKISWFNDTR